MSDEAQLRSGWGTCSICRYFSGAMPAVTRPRGGKTELLFVEGSCRRRAPVASDKGRSHQWPKVRSNDTCGDFRTADYDEVRRRAEEIVAIEARFT